MKTTLETQIPEATNKKTLGEAPKETIASTSNRVQKCFLKTDPLLTSPEAPFVDNNPHRLSPPTPLPGPIPGKFLPLVSHPTLKRHIKFTKEGHFIPARACNDLFDLPYDSEDIGKVPFNRVYKRQKLFLLDDPDRKKKVVRESLTCKKKKFVDEAELTAQRIDRVKDIYVYLEKTRTGEDKGRTILKTEWDDQKNDRCARVLNTLPKTHKVFKQWNLPKLIRQGKGDSKTVQELLQYDDDRTMIHHLGCWEKCVLAPSKQVKQVHK